MNDIYPTSVKRMGSNILLRCVDGNGNKTKRKFKYKPKFYTKCDKRESNTNITTMEKDALYERMFDSMYDANKWFQEFSTIPNYPIYGIKDFATQFMNDVFKYDLSHIYNPKHIRGANIDIEIFAGGYDADGYPVKYPYSSVEDASNPINMICLRDSKTGIVYLWGLKPESSPVNQVNDFVYDPDEFEIDTKYVTDLDYREFVDESELLRNFILEFASKEYEYWTGWNIILFDNPYLVNRIRNILGDSYVYKLSPWLKVHQRTVKTSWGDERTTYDWIGCETLDAMELYKKHTFGERENYKLNTIAHVEVDEEKIDYEEHNNLDLLYLQDYNKMCHYNIKDVILVEKIVDKRKLIDLTFFIAYHQRVNFQDTLATIKPWEAYIDNYHYHTNNAVDEIRPKNPNIDFKYEGGFVKLPQVGKHNNVISFDLDSQYPHTMQQGNMSLFTLVQDYKLRTQIRNEILDEIRDAIDVSDPADVDNLKSLFSALQSGKVIDDELVPCVNKIKFKTLKKYNVSLALNFEFFKLDEMSDLSIFTRELYAQRKAIKTEMKALKQQLVDLESLETPAISKITELKNLIASHDTKQMGIKIMINSLYGAIGNKWFRYSKKVIAEAITGSSRAINKYTYYTVNKFLNEYCDTRNVDYTIAGDTDSDYYCIEAVVLKHGWDKLSSIEITKNIDNWCETVLNPVIQQAALDYNEFMNGYENRMFWSREVIAETAVWTAKKRYAMIVNNNEGIQYDTPKMKVMGLEAIQSTYSEWSREQLKKCYKSILENDDSTELTALYKQIKKEFKELPLNDIAIVSNVNNVEKYHSPTTVFKKGCPRHVKGALTFNYMVDKLGLDYEKIGSGEKIKMLNLRKSNPTPTDVIAYTDFMPREFDLDNFIDYDSMFEKSFKNALDNFVSATDYAYVRKNTLF